MGADRSRLYDSISRQDNEPAASRGAAGLVASIPGIEAWCRGVVAASVLAACLTRNAAAQDSESHPAAAIPNANAMDTRPKPFKSMADSMAWERARLSAARATGFRVVVSLRERRIWVLRNGDTLRAAEAAVASGLTLQTAGRSWTFRTPTGRHTVLKKVQNPVWRPPDWLYAEAAVTHNLEVARLSTQRPVKVNDQELLVIRQERVGLLNRKTKDFAALPTDEHIVFNDTLYIPPFATQNRKVEGELGRYALDLGDGYLIHGTSDPTSIGRAVTHGCIRLGDDDIDWMYRNVPVGTAVLVY